MTLRAVMLHVVSLPAVVLQITIW